MTVPFRIIRVGQWELGKEPSSESTVPLQQREIRRIGTDIQTEEQSVGVVRSRTTPPFEEEEPSNPGSTANESTRPNDYYQFEWFWILILTILLSVIEATVFILLFLVNLTRRIVEVYNVVLAALGWILLPSFAYSATFVTISTFHVALKSMIESYMKISHKRQRTILRVAAWCWLPIILTLTIFAMLFSI